MRFFAAVSICFFMFVPNAYSVIQMAPFDQQMTSALESALSSAYELGDEEMIAKLQGIGVKLEHPPKPMEHRTAYNVEDATRNMNGSLRHAMRSAAIEGDLNAFKKIHALGVNINGSADDKHPPIIDAIQAESAAVITYIVNSKDFDPNQCAVSGFSALQIAAEEGNLKLVKLLLERGAKVDGCLGKGMGTSPYIEAAQRGNFEICKFLLQKGADGSFYDFRGNNAVSNAISRTAPLEIIKFMVKNGADVNTRMDAGTEIESTPLIRAAYFGRKDIMAYLVSVGADPSYRDPRGKTAQDHLKEATEKQAGKGGKRR